MNVRTRESKRVSGKTSLVDSFSGIKKPDGSAAKVLVDASAMDSGHANRGIGRYAKCLNTNTSFLHPKGKLSSQEEPMTYLVSSCSTWEGSTSARMSQLSFARWGMLLLFCRSLSFSWGER